ncbi:MAG: hypothetical protein ACBZ72_06755 [Candidatus Bathyarchaeia archaeon]|jgi:hypothetical protein
MSLNYQKGQEAEKLAKTYMQQRFACAFEPRKLQVGKLPDGSVWHNFDLVSFDCKIVAEVKAHTMTKTGNIPSAKIDNTYTACSMLEKVNAEKKFLLLTDMDFYMVFKRYSNGKIDEKIVIQLIPEENRKSKSSQSMNLHKEPIIPQDMSFDAFWSKLATFLASRRNIKNWTILKGYVGEDFKAVYDFGKIVVYPASASTQIVQRKDFKLIFDHWASYIDRTKQRKDLCENSRVTKYTISIIHGFLENGK